MTTKTKPKPTESKTKFDLNVVVTEALIAKLEAIRADVNGKMPRWTQPYVGNGGIPMSMSTGKAYRGINPLLLAFEAAAKGYGSAYWGTFKQIESQGGQVRKGEKSTLVVFWSMVESKTQKNKDGSPKRVGFLRYFRVFNAEQADWENGGLPEKFAPLERGEDFEPIDEAEAIVAGYLSNDGPTLQRKRQDVAYYQPSTDTVNVPLAKNMRGTHEYYSTLFHELGHSTGHAKRLNREGVADIVPMHKRGEVYSFEELVAEFSAGMLCGHAGITDTLDNSAAYLASWIKFLKDDPTAAVKAASKAQRSVDLIMGVTYEEAITA